MTVTEFKDRAEAVQSVLTSLAIVVGAFWFFWRRVRFPCVKVSHSIAHRAVREDKMLLRVSIHAENVGVVLVRPESIAVRIQQVCPFSADLESCKPVQVDRSEADWPVIGERTLHLSNQEVEPGEQDEFHFDFEVGADVQTILAYTYLKNSAKKKRWLFGKSREIGWNTTTLYDLREK